MNLGRSLKTLNLGPKITFCYFRHMLKLEFAKTIFIFQVSIPKYNKIQSFMQKGKTWKKKKKKRYFWAAILKNYCHIWNQHFPTFQNEEFHSKQKTLKLRSKMPYLGVFKLGFEETVVIFHARTLEFFKMQSFLQSRILKFGTSIALFGYFYPRIWKNQCHIWNKLQRYCETAKKNFRGQKCLLWVYLGCNFAKLLQYLKLVLSN